jgi:hypothetical protein
MGVMFMCSPKDVLNTATLGLDSTLGSTGASTLHAKHDAVQAAQRAAQAEQQQLEADAAAKSAANKKMLDEKSAVAKEEAGKAAAQATLMGDSGKGEVSQGRKATLLGGV